MGSKSEEALRERVDEGFSFHTALLFLQKSGKLSLFYQSSGLFLGSLQYFVLDNLFGALFLPWELLPDGGDVAWVGFQHG